MTKIDIISGFLGAGKTTFIKKLLQEAVAREQVVLIENEFGEIGIDGGFLKDSGIEIREMNSGCICCSLVGDFGKSLQEVLTKYHPDRVIIEPSGVGKLSDVMNAVRNVAKDLEVRLNSAVTVVDANKCRMYMKNFGEFFNNQVENAGTIVLSRTDVAGAGKVQKAVEMLREHNRGAAIVTTPIDQLGGNQLLELIEKPDTMMEELMEQAKAEYERSHHHHGDGCGEHHHDHGEDHSHEECHSHDHREDHGHGECHHHAHGEDHGHEECHHHAHEEDHGHGECHHHAHEEDHGHGECHPHAHEEGHSHEECHHHGDSHEHSHGPECTCGCHDHDSHDHHHADEVFSSWGLETTIACNKAKLEEILEELAYGSKYGDVLRAKGMLPGENPGEWYYFDLVPEEYEIRIGAPDYTGKICVIGANLKGSELEEAFGDGTND
ncbi:cobalamin biosynthesis protein CobW [Clostridiaceae bacterium]|nr:cobalamin biosynthesis protein CobW [Clostridiaceae bacterium]